MGSVSRLETYRRLAVGSQAIKNCFWLWTLMNEALVAQFEGRLAGYAVKTLFATCVCFMLP